MGRRGGIVWFGAMSIASAVATPLVVPLAAQGARDDVVDNAAYWRPAVSIGAWAMPGIEPRPAEPTLGMKVTADAVRVRTGRRLGFMTMLGVYSKSRGVQNETRLGVIDRWIARNDMAFVGLGAEMVLASGRVQWTAGLVGGPGMTRIAYRYSGERDNPVTQPPGQGRWSLAGLVLGRTAITMPMSPRLGLRAGVDAFSGVEPIFERAPLMGANVGVVFRR